MEESLRENPHNATLLRQEVKNFPYHFKREEKIAGALYLKLYDAASRWAIGRHEGTIEAAFPTWVYPEWQHMKQRIEEEERGDTHHRARMRDEANGLGEEVYDDYISAHQMQADRHQSYEFAEQHLDIGGCDLVLPAGMMIRAGLISTGGATAVQHQMKVREAKTVDRRINNKYWDNKPFKD